MAKKPKNYRRRLPQNIEVAKIFYYTKVAHEECPICGTPISRTGPCRLGVLHTVTYNRTDKVSMYEGVCGSSGGGKKVREPYQVSADEMSKMPVGSASMQMTF